MMLGNDLSLTSFFLCGSLVLYSAALIPQIILNCRLSSVSGLSDAYLYAFFLGYIAETYYVMCLNFHPAYTLLVPLALFATTILVIQRFYYHSIQAHPYLFGLYVVTVLVSLAVVPFTRIYAVRIGNLTGWLATMLWCTYQIPQVIRNSAHRSIEGFSTGLTIMLGIAALCEFVCALIAHLPLQTLITAIRGIFLAAIFLFQFWKYR